MKKLLLLGGSRYLLPAIKAAHDLGVYVITADYLPDNYAHQFSDEYHNVSIIDRDAVLKLAEDLNIDGIMSYATDPGVVVAAYVADKLGLPTSPVKSVAILQNKGKFRKFLAENGFNVPFARSYKYPEDALKDASLFRWPVIIKPTDSAGSKGVTKVDDKKDIVKYANHALEFSLTNEFIMEEFIEKKGFSSDTDSFSIDGKLVFTSFNDQWFDSKADNPYTPAGFIFPSGMPLDIQKELHSELQRLLKLLDMGTTIYNIETRQGVDGKPYIMECSPRAGGNRLAEMLKLACGQDIITASVKAALGMPIEEKLTDPVYKGHWGEVILHSNKSGILKEIFVDSEFKKKYIKELDLWVKPGDEIHEFSGANETIGTVVLQCESLGELTECLNTIYDHIRVEVEEEKSL